MKTLLKETIEEIKKKAIIVYIKKSNRKPTKLIGCLVAIKDNDLDLVKIGWSKYASNRESTPFNKDKALTIALGRACIGKLYSLDELPYTLQEPMKIFMTRVVKYFRSPPTNIENINKDLRDY